MNEDLRAFLIAASFGLIVAASLIYSTGYDGKVAGVGIGPSVPWLRVAGH